MLKIDATIEHAESVAASLAGAKARVLDRWYSTIRRHAYRTVAIIQTQYRGAAATSVTATRQGTGVLRASYAQQTERDTNGVTATIGVTALSAKGNALQYARVHERGATIRPKRAQYLAIPLPTIRSPSGIAPPPRSFANTFVIRGARGLVIMQRLGKGSVRPLFALRSQVTIPARPPQGAINAAFDQVSEALTADLAADAVAASGSAP